MTPEGAKELVQLLENLHLDNDSIFYAFQLILKVFQSLALCKIY